MKSPLRSSTRPLSFLLFLAAVLPLGVACSESQCATTETLIVDQPLESYRLDLLGLAFGAASKLPLMPHIKNRARAQAEVVATCFELEQPKRALGYVEDIPNWRRGVGYAEYAFYCAERGATSQVQPYLDKALAISENPEDETLLGWRKSRIRAAIARTHALLGQFDRAAEFAEDLEDSEAGDLAVMQARLSDERAFERDLESTNTAIQAGSMEQIQNSLEQCVVYFDRYYEDPGRRSLAESRIVLAEGKLPLLIHLDLLMKLTDAALRHEDLAKAKELLAWIDQLMEGQRWLPRHELPVVARVSVLRRRAGDVELARAEVDEALASFEAQKDMITDIFRAETITPLAEAYHELGDTKAALAVYATAVEEAVHNPNSRPRAMDLTTILCSMARNGVEPAEALWVRIREVCGELGDPW